LRWVVADGVGSKSGRLVRSVVVSGARLKHIGVCKQCPIKCPMICPFLLYYIPR
jgi:hypothetical protein